MGPLLFLSKVLNYKERPCGRMLTAMGMRGPGVCLRRSIEMSSRARIAGHPIHPMLVGFPISLWVFSLISDIVFMSGGSATWNVMAWYTMGGGIIGALIAAVPGLIDLLGFPASRARRLGITHMSINLAIVALYAVNFYLRGFTGLGMTPAFAMSVIGVGALLVSGWLGGEMIYVEGVAYRHDDRHGDKHGKKHEDLVKEEVPKVKRAA